MSIDNKKINIVSDVNFDGNNITDAKINAQENTISNLEVSNFKSGVIQTTVRDTTNALDTAIPTEKAVSEALSNIQINVVELDEGTNIDNLRQEGTFFIKNPTGTLPSITTFELDPEYDTYWCILTQEKCFDNTRGTYWYIQTGKFSYLSSLGITKIEAWQTYVRQINDYTYTDKKWQRLDNLTERIFDQPPTTEAADMSVNLNTFSDAESNSVINIGYIEGLGWRTIKSLELVSSLNGSCKIFFKTYTGVPPYGTNTFSVIVSSYTSAQILNLDILTNYNFKFNTVYELNFQQISSGTGKFSVRVTEIDKPFVQEYFPSQTGNSGKFLTTDGTTMSWVEVQGGSSHNPGFGFRKASYIIGESSDIGYNNNVVSLPFWEHASVGTLIFINGDLLNLMQEYELINSSSIYMRQSLQTGDVIAIVNGLDILSRITGVTGTDISCGDYINESVLIFKNGKLLIENEDYTTNQGTITFTVSLVQSDQIILTRIVTNINKISGQSGTELTYEGPEDNIVFKNGKLLSLGIDYEVEEIDAQQSQYKLVFEDSLISTDIIFMIYNEPYSLYTLLGDKQDKLPIYQAGKVLGTDGNKLQWVNAGGGSSYTAGGGLYIDNNEIGMNRNTAFYNSLYLNSKDDNILESDIQFDMNTFYSYTGGADNNFYNFIYMNGAWNLRKMNYSTWDWDYIGEVDLTDYGITYSGTPFENGWFILAGNYLTGKTNFTVVMLSFSNVFLNGILLTEDLDFTRNDNTITFINYTLKATDRIQVI